MDDSASLGDRQLEPLSIALADVPATGRNFTLGIKFRMRPERDYRWLTYPGVFRRVPSATLDGIETADFRIW